METSPNETAPFQMARGIPRSFRRPTPVYHLIFSVRPSIKAGPKWGDGAAGPSFVALAERMHVGEAGRDRQLSAALPVTYMIFDVLEANGTDITSVPYVERRECLESLAPSLGDSSRWIVPPRFSDGA